MNYFNAKKPPLNGGFKLHIDSYLFHLRDDGNSLL